MSRSAAGAPRSSRTGLSPCLAPLTAMATASSTLLKLQDHHRGAHLYQTGRSVHRFDYREATYKLCMPRPITPSSSLTVDTAKPMPDGSTVVAASRQTHSPTGR